MSDINDLRTCLFDAIKGLKDGTLDLEKAKAIGEISQTIINTAKVEVDYMKVAGNTIISSGFIPEKEGSQRRITTPTGTKTTESVPGGSVSVHRIR